MSAFNNPKGLSVITIPMKMKKQIEKVKELDRIKHKQDVLKKSRAGKVSIPIITCKNTKLNFYKGQTYSKFDSVELASRGWKSRKTKGDFFTIHKCGQNPAFQSIEDVPDQFEDMGLNPRLVEQLNRNGFVKPTNIQTLAIPHILEGSNTVIAAETGNGKTLAFLAPIMHQVLEDRHTGVDDRPLNSPTVLIILPGRELAIQTRDMARELGADLGVNINSVIGGRTKRMMLRPRVSTPDILVGSFGAISKLTTTRVYKLDRVKHIVLDEADTLLDDSFNEAITYFLKKFPIRGNVDSCVDTSSGTQVSLVGATFPTSISSVLHKIIEVDSLVHVKTPHLHRISPHISQTFLRVGHDERAERLLKVARRNHKLRIPTIIFSNSYECCDWVSFFLTNEGIPCPSINGQMGAEHRIGKFRSFQNEDYGFISATDLVSRGLNTTRANHILNFDFPPFMSDYIHRCGRTGRVGGAEGGSDVTSFVYRSSDIDLVNKLEYAARKQEVLPNVNANIKRIITARQARLEERREQEELMKNTKTR